MWGVGGVDQWSGGIMEKEWGAGWAGLASQVASWAEAQSARGPFLVFFVFFVFSFSFIYFLFCLFQFKIFMHFLNMCFLHHN